MRVVYAFAFVLKRSFFVLAVAVPDSVKTDHSIIKASNMCP